MNDYEYELMFCLASIVQAYDDLPETGDELDGWIEKARGLVKQNASPHGRLDDMVTK